MYVLLVPEYENAYMILNKYPNKKIKINDLEIYECSKKNKKFLVVITDYGKINISHAITIINNTYKTIKLIQIGTAGSIGKTQDIFDAAISNASLQYDIDFKSLGYDSFTLPNQRYAIYNSNEDLIKQLKEICSMESVYYKVGITGTSDSFLSNSELSCKLNRLYGIETVDCECGSVGQIAEKLKIPFVGLKVISNYASDTAINQYKLYDGEASEICQKLAIRFIENFI